MRHVSPKLTRAIARDITIARRFSERNDRVDYVNYLLSTARYFALFSARPSLPWTSARVNRSLEIVITCGNRITRPGIFPAEFCRSVDGRGDVRVTEIVLIRLMRLK